MRAGRVLAASLGALALAAPAAPAMQPSPAPPRILITGDSMIMYTDALLRRTLHAQDEARVVVARHVATGLAKPWLLEWHKHAALQMRRHRPETVIASMGANDIHPIGRAACCGPAWAARYAARIERLARAWKRGGARRVYWLTLPIQAHARLEPLFSGVNAAVERARGIRVIDVRPIVNPGGLYHHELEVAPGVIQQIRYEDGVHLWWPGARLVAEAVIARLRLDGALRRP
jgi:hypothetical protein